MYKHLFTVLLALERLFGFIRAQHYYANVLTGGNYSITFGGTRIRAVSNIHITGNTGVLLMVGISNLTTLVGFSRPDASSLFTGKKSQIDQTCTLTAGCYGIGMRYANGKMYLKKTKLTLNASAPVIAKCSPGRCDLEFPYDRYPSVLAPINATHCAFGKRLGVFTYSNMSDERTFSKNNLFKYVICIDASTCIAADDRTDKVRYFNVSNSYIKSGGNSVDEILLADQRHNGVIGISGSGVQKMIILCTTGNCYIKNYQTNGFRTFPLSDATNLAVVFTPNIEETVVAATSEGVIRFYKPFAANFVSSGNASFTSVAITPGEAVDFKISESATYVAFNLAETNQIYLYEKKPCHTSCATCSGPNDNDCQTCLAPKNWLDSVNSKCSICSGSTEVKFANMTCGRCASGCSSCLPTNKMNCTACIPGLYLSNSNTCVACSSNITVIVGTNCKSCNSNCTTCSGNQTNCTSCPVNYCLDTTSGAGVCNPSSAYTANGSYLTLTTNVPIVTKCGKCRSGCQLCRNELDCINCGPGMYEASDFTCIQCTAPCATCTNIGTNCTSCSSGHLLLTGTDGICSACNIGNVYITIDGRCEKCNSACGSCNITADNCTTCFNSSQYVYDNGTCNACGDGFYTSGSNCLECHSNCATCVGAPRTCTSCNTGEFIQGSTSVCGSCLPQDRVYVAGNLTCQNCSSNCSTCAMSSTSCTRCEDGYVLSASNSTCDDCGDGFFVQSGDRKCYSCSINCLTCDKAADQCLSCSSTLYLNSSNVCEDCKRPYVGILDRICIDCDVESNCLHCDGDSARCTECPPDMNLTIMTADNNKCGNNCNATGGSYIETVSGVSYCKQCDSSCADCLVEGTNCTKCNKGFYLSGNQCILCSPNCFSCTSSTDCYECSPGFLMLPNMSCISEAQCKQTTGSFMNGTNCSDCSPTCKSCFGSAASCTSCIAGQYLSATNTCVPCTENGYYHNSTNCLQCDSSCLTCNGSTSTDCRSCVDSLVLTDEHSCLIIPALILESATFKSDMELAIFTFDQVIKVRASEAQIGLYFCPPSTLVPLLKTSSELPVARSECEPFREWNVKEISYDGVHLKVKLDIQKTIEGATLVVRSPEKGWWQAQANKMIRYSEDYLIVENVTVIKSALDGMMDSAAAPAAAAMTTVQLVVMTISTPQAFILMKVLQTLDYYIYIDCNYPSNFAKFLDMITNSAFDYLPNFFEMLVDNDGLPLYERFAEYGMKVHIFANLGQIYSIAMILGALKLLFLMATKVWSKAGKFYKAVGAEVFFGLFESYNLDSMLSVIIFIANRERINSRQDAVKYLVIVFVSLFSLFMISMYLFMGYTVSRLTDSYFKHAVVEVKHMKNESWKFLLEDKNMHGNIFQRHFNLIQLFKDIVFAALLYALYYKPLVLIILLTLIQAVYATAVLAFPPYCIPWMNLSLKITQVLYLILDLFFFLLIAWGGQFTEKTRYYLIGFSMIVLVLIILACNIGFSLYSTLVQLRKKYLKYKNKKAKSLTNQAKIHEENLNANPLDKSEFSSTQNLPNETSFCTSSKKPLISRPMSKTTLIHRKKRPVLGTILGQTQVHVIDSSIEGTMSKTTITAKGSAETPKESSQKTIVSKNRVQKKRLRPPRTLSKILVNGSNSALSSIKK